MSSFEVLRKYLEDRADFSKQELVFVQGLFVPRMLKVGEFLQRAGEIATHTAFVASGCLRTYVIDEKGKEHIVKFGPETWWIGDNESMANSTPSHFYIDAIEDSELLLIDLPSHQKILQQVPGYAAAFQRGILKHAAAKDKRILSSLAATAEERYLDFMQTYPSIATRVPQWMLASYLGVSPETVSRIRNKLSRRKSAG